MLFLSRQHRRQIRPDLPLAGAYHLSYTSRTVPSASAPLSRPSYRSLRTTASSRQIRRSPASPHSTALGSAFLPSKVLNPLVIPLFAYRLSPTPIRSDPDIQRGLLRQTRNIGGPPTTSHFCRFPFLARPTRLDTFQRCGLLPVLCSPSDAYSIAPNVARRIIRLHHDLVCPPIRQFPIQRIWPFT